MNKQKEVTRLELIQELTRTHNVLRKMYPYCFENSEPNITCDRILALLNRIVEERKEKLRAE